MSMDGVETLDVDDEGSEVVEEEDGGDMEGWRR